MKPFERPFKTQCPSCERVFPSNDFAAGEMTGGDYPDDGSGCKIGDDTCYLRTVYQPYLRRLAQATVLAEHPKRAPDLSTRPGMAHGRS